MADALLTVENLTKSYGDKLLFDNISFGINAGQKTALIARNGYGKSTLLNILTGKTLQDEGKVTFSSEVKMAYLPQQPEMLPHQTLRSFVYSVERPEHEDEWTPQPHTHRPHKPAAAGRAHQPFRHRND